MSDGCATHKGEERLLYEDLGRVISQVSVRHSCLYFTAILVSTFGLHLLLRVLFSLRKQTNVSFHMIFLQDFKDVFFSPQFLSEPAVLH